MLPCKEVHWRILPAISRELALRMEKDGIERRRIALALGTTCAAVSQYISGKRGRGAALSKGARQACKDLAKRMGQAAMRPEDTNAEISRIIVIAKGSRLGDSDPCMICGVGNAVRRRTR